MSVWFETLPAGWVDAPLKSRLLRNDGGVWGQDPDGDNDTVVLRSTEQRVDGAWQIDEPAARKLSPSERDSALLEVGDLVVTKSSGSDLHIGKTSLVTKQVSALGACYSNFMQRLRVDGRTEARFVHYWMNSTLCREQFSYLSSTTSGLANLNGEMLGKVRMAFPDRPTQERIANFLDEQTARIDALIAEKERFAACMEEYRRAQIYALVTRGSGESMKFPTHVAWLGEVPAHWRVVPIKQVARLESGHTPDKKVSSYWENCDIPWVSLNDTGRLLALDYIYETKVNINQAGLQNSSARLLPEGTVFFSRDATIGRCGIAARPMACSQHFIGWVCGPHLLPEYLLYVLRSMSGELERLTAGATLKTIGMDDVKKLAIPLPPLEEQRCIVALARSWNAEGVKLQRCARVSADLLREYRSSLISAAVTGRLDIDNFKKGVA